MKQKIEIPQEVVEIAVQTALVEDLAGHSDITTNAVVPPTKQAEGRIFARAPGVVAGMPLALAIFKALDPEVEILAAVGDGLHLEAGTDLLRLRGSARALLVGERSALNYLTRLSGIATMTKEYVNRVAGTGVSILETRKTTPGLRLLEKYAVVVGGGANHRVGLFDRVLLKENHFSLSGEGQGVEAYQRTVARAVVAAGDRRPVMAEARTRDEALAAVEGGADIVLLDNMRPEELTATVQAGRERGDQLGRSVLFEATGGISLSNLREMAVTGVDRISIGALTHSVMPLDLSMLIAGI